jgi:hypothetical protein
VSWDVPSTEQLQEVEMTERTQSCRRQAMRRTKPPLLSQALRRPKPIPAGVDETNPNLPRQVKMPNKAKIGIKSFVVLKLRGCPRFLNRGGAATRGSARREMPQLKFAHSPFHPRQSVPRSDPLVEARLRPLVTASPRFKNRGHPRRPKPIRAEV